MTNLWSLGHGAVANLDATNTSLKLINVDGTKGDNSLPLVANTSTPDQPDRRRSGSRPPAG